MPIYNYLDLSTAHIEKSDSEILHNHAKFRALKIPFRVIEHDYGFWVNIQPHIANEFNNDPSNGDETLLSSNFIKVYQYASNNNCNWINFDGDAEIDDNFPVCE